MFKSDKGFSLVELLIVVAIIGTLSAIGIPKYTQYKAKSRRAECLTTGASVGKLSAVMMTKNDESPCRVSQKSSLKVEGKDVPGCSGSVQFPVSGVGPQDTQKYYYSYNVGPGSANTANVPGNWYPRMRSNAPNPNRLGLKYAVTLTDGSTSYPNEDFVVSCSGRIYTGNKTLDVIKIQSTGGVSLWRDNVTGKTYKAGKEKFLK